ncbi:hypothetical protein GCK32_016914 [Trichostrongylus colubriformis]|uniref:L-Fucosyltransferase n=1 Tax=Trichostrongylus colubriformis TaxID=6319 RepID=A0AAN8IP11_TRICO
MDSSCKSLLAVVVFVQFCFILWIHSWLMRNTGDEAVEKKYVALHLNDGRMGNQLFHMINGYAIARTIGRIHYLPYEDRFRDLVVQRLKQLERVFPAIKRTYVIDKSETNRTLVKFANKSCCVYDDPKRLLNYDDKYLLLDFAWVQNPRYFEGMIEEVREILEFSPSVVSEGNHLLDMLKLNSSSLGNFSFWDRPQQSTLCIHIRRTDFLERNISTNMMDTVVAANDIARGMVSFYLKGTFHDGLFGGGVLH